MIDDLRLPIADLSRNENRNSKLENRERAIEFPASIFQFRVSALAGQSAIDNRQSAIAPDRRQAPC
jgi:hypothetical protein